MDEKLIQLVRDHEELYDGRHKLYFDNAIKNKKWMEIADKLNNPVVKCKQRWKSLRSQHRKICRLRQTNMDKKLKKWRYEEEMAFLIPYMKEKTRSSLLFTDKDGNDQNKNGSQTEIITKIEVVGTEEDRNQIQDVPIDASSTFVTKKKRMLYRKKPLTKTANARVIQYILNKEEAEEKKDHIDLFFESIKSTVRTFSAADFHTAKAGIFNIVSEIESKYVRMNINTDNLLSL
ncbi:hypothetical protein FQA39_LY02422 [Lamprigera yunnana]|nr:hypothetical protein FQA39_LY02422 [Lamprigera yunnana]